MFSDNSRDENRPSSDSGSGLQVAMTDLLDAIQRKDAKAMAEIFKDALTLASDENEAPPDREREIDNLVRGAGNRSRGG